MLVGRDEELALAADQLRGSQPLVVAGEAGIGKTTLLRAAIEQLGRPLYEGGALATLQWMPFLPLNRAVARELEGDAPFVARELEEAVGDGVLFVDDVQWADRETRRVLPLLAERVPLGVAVRLGDPGADDVLALLASAGFRRLDLGPLGDDEALELARRDAGVHDEAARELARRAGGNPLLLRELISAGEPSSSLRAALLRRLKALSSDAQDAFARLALLGRPAELALLGDGAEELVTTDLVVSDGATFAARHALLSEIVAEELDDAVRVRLHAELAEMVEDPGEAARHHYAAGERPRALERAREAAEGATTAGERAEHLRLAAAAAEGDNSQTLRLEAARALFDARELAAAEALFGDLAVADPEERAWVAYMQASAAMEHGDSSAAHDAIKRGLAEVEGLESAVEVRLRTAASQVALFLDHEMKEARRLAEESLTIARERAADEAGALLVLGCALATGAETDDERSEALLEEAARKAREEGDVVTEIKASYNWFLGGRMPVYDADRARPRAEALLLRTREHRLAGYERQVRALLGRIDFHAGAFDRVVENLEALLDEALHPQARLMARTYLIPALIDLGEFDRATAQLAELRDDPSSRNVNHVVIHWHEAELEFWSGRPRQALAAAEAALDPGRSTLRTLFEPYAAVIGAWAATELGTVPPAPVEFVTPSDARVHATSVELAALERLASSDPRGAIGPFRDAAQLAARCDRRSELRALWGLGESQRLAGDLAAARATLEQVEARAREHGMKPLVARVERGLRLAGARRAAPRTHDESGITAREREILELVATGLSNAEIARRLGLGRPTVVQLIGSASRKLGARNRKHAAALALNR